LPTVRIPIVASTLRWARVEGRVSELELANYTGISVSKVQEFESAISLPTYAQMKKMALKLDRTLPFFFGPPPRESDIPQTIDFRHGDNTFPSFLVRSIKRANYHRKTYLELVGEESIKSIPQIRATSASEAAQEFRSMFNLGIFDTPRESSNEKAFRYWRHLLEGEDFLILQVSRIPLEIFRGFSIYHDSLPVIVINGADSSAGKIFTLFHELGHIATRTSGICLLSEKDKVEVFCNSFAEEFLMPTQSFTNFQADQDFSSLVDRVARKYRVSQLAAAIKLKSLGFLSQSEVDQIRAQTDEAWLQSRERQRESTGAPPHHVIRYRDLGSKYVEGVSRAIQRNQISILDASYFLNARVASVDKIISEHNRQMVG
jgi:Zn-dependent peptidase ImmA (M78 family)/transcriptional regulator with XRE-family HTH domain